jgi:3-oxoadipate enol-lactonase
MSTCALHHRITGPADAPAVVFTGSLGTDLSMWDPQAQSLAHRFRVICCDVRGHGGSPVPPGPYSIAELGGDLLALLDRLELTQAHLVGLSIGAMISLWVAAAAPARVGRLVACCTSAHFGSETSVAYRERAGRVRAGGLEPIADGVVARWLTPAFAAARPDVVARLRAGLVATAPEGYAGCCEALAELDLRAALEHITAPTLVLVGEEDPATPPAHGQVIAAGVSAGRLCAIPSAAHLASVERAELVTALILRFLLGGDDE